MSKRSNEDMNINLAIHYINHIYIMIVLLRFILLYYVLISNLLLLLHKIFFIFLYNVIFSISFYCSQKKSLLF